MPLSDKNQAVGIRRDGGGEQETPETLSREQGRAELGVWGEHGAWRGKGISQPPSQQAHSQGTHRESGRQGSQCFPAAEEQQIQVNAGR